MSFDTQIGTREGIEEAVRAGDIDDSSIESINDLACRAKRYSDGQYWEFKMSAENFRAWRSISHVDALSKIGNALFGKRRLKK